ncbi:MAG: hypothetical protein ACKPBV_21045, partial [Sphaerospermopsis kisseleviana]
MPNNSMQRTALRAADDAERSLSELEESRNLCMKKWSLPSRMASTITATPLAITFSAPEIESDDV